MNHALELIDEDEINTNIYCYHCQSMNRCDWLKGESTLRTFSYRCGNTRCKRLIRLTPALSERRHPKVQLDA